MLRISVLATALLAGTAIAQEQMRPVETPSNETFEPRTGLPIGTKAPDSRVLDEDGKLHSLGNLIDEANGPVVLIFYRGGWCPYCTKHLAELGARQNELAELGAKVFAISPESFDKLEVTETKAKLSELTDGYTILSDVHAEASRRYNLIFAVDDATQKRYKNYGIDLKTWNADGEWNLPVPAVFIIDKSGIIKWRHVDEDYTKRVDADKLIEAIKKLQG